MYNAPLTLRTFSPLKSDFSGQSAIETAANLIKQGKLVAFPTETVYGLGASVFLPRAIETIFKVKGRPQDNPLIVHISNLSQLSLIAKEVPEKFDLLAQAFFPGPLTVLVPKKDCVPSIVSANLSTIGVRMPAHPIALQLIEAVGVPIVAPSANISGKPSSTTAQHVLEDFGENIAGILDGGPCQYGIESTVITFSPFPLILRPGAVSADDLEYVLKCPIALANEQAMMIPTSPGMKYKHYAPRAKVIVFHSENNCKKYLNASPKCKRVILKNINPVDLYSLFRTADAEQQQEILIVCNEIMRQNQALMNRINKACC